MRCCRTTIRSSRRSRHWGGRGSITTGQLRCWPVDLFRDASPMMPPLPIRLTLTLVVSIAAFTDLKWRRIPNWLTLPALPVGLIAQSVYGAGFWQGLGGALAGLLALLPLFL